MTALHLCVPFVQPLPSIGAVAAQVALTTGLSVRYEHVSLCCDSLGEAILLYPDEELLMAYGITVFDPGNYKSDYFLNATLRVLVDLGGQYAEPLPDWAGKPWEIARLLL
jgi:hypothetical protein